jgi:hypothetical protein
MNISAAHVMRNTRLGKTAHVLPAGMGLGNVQYA